MTASMELHDYLDSCDIPGSVDRDWLVATVLKPLTIDADGHFADLCEDIIVSSTADGAGELHMRPGGWRINLTPPLAKAAISAAIVGAGLISIGADQIPMLVLPAVLPLLIELEKVKLNTADRELLIPLRHASVGVEGMAVQPKLLYNRLDPADRAQLNYHDFVAFLERLIEAGELDDAGLGEVRPRQSNRPAWIRITWT